MVSVARNGDVVHDVIGDLADHLAGQDLECQLHRVAIEVGHTVEQSSEMGDGTELHRAGSQVIDAQHTHREETLGEARVSLAFREVELATVEPGADHGLAVQRDLTGEVARARSIEHGPDRTRTRRLELEQPARRAWHGTAGKDLIHHWSHRPQRGVP